MFTTIRSTTNAKSKFLGLLALACFSLASTGLSGCAGLVSSANAGKSGAGSTALTISGATAAAATLTGFQADWTTSVPATSQVNYGKTTSYGSTTGINSTMVSTHELPVANLTPGTIYHFQIQSTDASGNSASSADMTVTTLTDTTPPTVSITSPAGGATISGTAVILSASASDNVAVASVQFKIDSASTGSPVTTAPYTHAINTTTLSNGNHTLTAVATDTAGNATTSAAVSIKVSNTTADTTPPTVLMTAPANGTTVSNTVTVSATASDNVAVASVQFQLDNANVGAADIVGPYTYSWDTTKSTNGTHTLRAIATDTSNNSATSASMTVTVNNAVKDTTPPTVSMTAPASGATVSNTVTVSANASDNVAVASVQFQLDNTNVGAADTVAPYTFSWNTTTATNGAHTLRAIATDTSNNSATSSSVTVTVNNAAKDTTPPTVSMTAPATGATVSNTVTVSANASDNVAVASVQFQLDNANVGAADTVAPYAFSWNTTTATNGAHTLRAIATDTSNNSTTSSSVTVTVNNSSTDTTPPTVPTGLVATAASSSQISLNWTASTDNVGVTGYKVFRGGAQVGTSATNSFLDAGLTASTAYTYTVAAYDAAGNTSAQSTGASATTLAASTGGGLPSTVGWFQIPNTTGPACPSGFSGCANVVAAWSGGTADQVNNKLYVFGGGHSDYSGNEVYSLDLNALTFGRINNPSTPDSDCGINYSDNTPTSRHSYGGLAFLPASGTAGAMYVFGGSLYPCGGTASDTWLFDVGTKKWTNENPAKGTLPAQIAQYQAEGDVAGYDPSTQSVFICDNTSMFRWVPTTDTYANVGHCSESTSGSNSTPWSGTVDPKRHKMFIFGYNQINSFDLTNLGGTQQLTSVTNASGCPTGFSAAGVAYDSVLDRIVIWGGGNTVYLYAADTNTCTSQTYTGGPTCTSASCSGGVQANGTFGRFAYFPNLDVFAVVNDWGANAYALRLTAGSGSTSGPNISGISVTSITTTGATISWTTDVAATTQVEYGTTTAYGTLTTLNSSLVTSHSQALTGLAVGTAYHYRVHSKNSSGIESISGDAVFSTNNTTDTTPPTISMTAPAANATVSGNVTVSANASDNVAVARVQFLLDGASLGAAVTASPYQVTWNTTTASNGAHSLSATATDTSGNMATTSILTVNVSNSVSGAAAAALADFNARCTAAGVVLCQSFDTSAGFQQNVNIYANGTYTTVFPSQDSTTSRSGTSLRIDVPPFQGSNSGKFDTTFPDIGGNGADIYFQLATRISPEMLSNYVNFNWPTWKNHGFFHGNTSCTGLMMVTGLSGSTQPGEPLIPEGTSGGCSATGLVSNNGNPPYLLQQGDYNCQYRDVTASTCFVWPSNTWVTFYYHIKLGTLSSTTGNYEGTLVQAYVGINGAPYKQWINLPNFSYASDGAGANFNHLELYPYMTGKDATQGGYPTAHVWYDELIVSTQPILAPAVPPALP